MTNNRVTPENKSDNYVKAKTLSITSLETQNLWWNNSLDATCFKSAHDYWLDSFDMKIFIQSNENNRDCQQIEMCLFFI